MKAVLITLFAFIASYSQADPYLYGGVQFGSYKTKFDSDLTSFSPKGVGVLVGIKRTDTLGLELRTGTGLGHNESELTVLDQTIEVDFNLDNYVSLYIRAEKKFKYIKTYAVFGYSATKFTVKSEHLNDDISGWKSGTSYGFGIGYENSDNVSFNLEYLNVIDTDTYLINGTNLSIQFSF
jgi:opacity protein-like surface antigen